MKMHKPAKM